MTQLAPELARWREALDLFPSPLDAEVGAMVRRLAAVVGDLRATPRTGLEPNGFDGVGSRGPYERLLLTEWLLASEVPDEFLRRAAMHEHLFLELLREEPRGGQRTVVVFDGGPSQLGSPRLAHLVLLLLLHRRAMEAGAGFTWGVAQDGTPQSMSGRDGVRHLLDARSPRNATSRDIDTLAHALALGDRGDDVWWVGGKRFQEHCADRAGSRVSIQDDLNEAGDQLRIQLSVGSRRQEVRLPLPAPDLRARLLRHPFTPVAAPRTRAPTGADLRFCASGKHLLVRSVDALQLYSVGGAQVGAPRPLIPSPGAVLIGANMVRREVIKLERRDDTFTLHVGHTKTRLTFGSVLPEFDGVAGSAEVFVGGRGVRRVFVKDTAGTVYAGELGATATETLEPVVDGVQRLVWRKGHLDYTRIRQDEWDVGRITLERVVHGQARFPVGDAPEAVAGHARDRQQGAVAVRVPPAANEAGTQLWQVHDTWRGFPVEAISVDQEVRVFGLRFRERSSSIGWELLVVSANGREIRTSGGEVLASAPNPIETIVMADVVSRLAFVCGGHVFVEDLQDGGMRRRIADAAPVSGSPGGTAP